MLSAWRMINSVQLNNPLIIKAVLISDHVNIENDNCEKG